MMTRNIRKVLSIVCAVALVMSLCVVSLIGTSSAFKATDAPLGTETKLTFDDAADMASKNDDGKVKIVDDNGNKVVSITVAKNGPYLFGFANSDKTGKFEITPGDTYLITFRYKILAGATGTKDKVGLYLYNGLSAIYGESSSIRPSGTDTGHRTVLRAVEYKLDAANSTGSKGSYVLKEDTEWMTARIVYTATKTLRRDEPLTFMLSAGDTAKTQSLTAYVDDVTIDTVTEEENINATTVYDFKGADGSYTDVAGQAGSWQANQGAPSVDANGLHFSGNTVSVGSTPNWIHKGAIADPDYGSPVLKSGATYSVTVKYKLEAKAADVTTANLNLVYSGNNKTAGFAAAADGSAAPGLNTGAANFLGAYIASDSKTADTAVSTDWQTFIYSFTATDAMHGCNLLLSISTDSKGVATYCIKSVTVKEVYSKDGATAVTFITNGGNAMGDDIYPAGTDIKDIPVPTHSNANKGFAGWYLDVAMTKPATKITGSKLTLYAKWQNANNSGVTFNNSGEIYTKNLAIGSTLPNPVRPNTAIFFEGWYLDLDFTQKITKVPVNDCTVYAKYTYVYNAMNNQAFASTLGNKVSIDVDPDDATNNVLKHYVPHGNFYNFGVSAYDAVGADEFTLKLNTKYYISFRYKVVAGSTGGLVELFYGEKAGTTDATKVSTGISIRWDDATGAEGTEWVTVEKYLDMGDTYYFGSSNVNPENGNFSKLEHLYVCCGGREGGVNNKGTVTVLFDDIIIGEYSEEVPTGAVGIYFESNADKIPPRFGYKGEKITMPEDPTLSAHKFIGWYTDKALKVPFTAKTFSDKTIKLYAKWEATEWVMDFDNFSATSVGHTDRAIVDSEGSNNYLDYQFARGTSGAAASSGGRVLVNRGMDDIYNLNPGVSYTITLKYKALEVNSETAIAFRNVEAQSLWRGSSQLFKNEIKISNVTNDWITVTTKFKADIGESSNTCLSLDIKGDAHILVDDVKVVPEVDVANVYGSVIISFETNGGNYCDAISGDPGDAITLPKPSRPGFIFNGWYKDTKFKSKFTDKKFGEEGRVLHASWILAKFSEGFEDYPEVLADAGIGDGYSLYDKAVTGFDKANVKGGSASIFRDGSVTDKGAVTLCRDADTMLTVGQQYVISFYVKPTAVNDAAGVINLVGIKSNTAVTTAVDTIKLADVATLKVGEWQKVTYTFTATNPYVALAATAGNDMYFDNITLNIEGYTGSSTGDSSVNPFVMMALVILTAGALVVTGKKVYEK